MARLLTNRSKKRKVAVKEAPPDLSWKQKVYDEIRVCDSFIAAAARKGESYCNMSHPGDKMFAALKEHYQKKGFQVSEFSTDEGYCNGDVWHIAFHW